MNDSQRVFGLESFSLCNKRGCSKCKKASLEKLGYFLRIGKRIFGYRLSFLESKNGMGSSNKAAESKFTGETMVNAFVGMTDFGFVVIVIMGTMFF